MSACVHMRVCARAQCMCACVRACVNAHAREYSKIQLIHLCISRIRTENVRRSQSSGHPSSRKKGKRKGRHPSSPPPTPPSTPSPLLPPRSLADEEEEGGWRCSMTYKKLARLLSPDGWRVEDDKWQQTQGIKFLPPPSPPPPPPPNLPHPASPIYNPSLLCFCASLPSIDRRLVASQIDHSNFFFSSRISSRLCPVTPNRPAE